MNRLTTKSKALVVSVVLAVAAVVGYWYYSPYLAIASLYKAAQAKDVDAFNDHVDYPKLRESFKGQFAALVAKKMGQAASAESSFAVMGAALGVAMVNQVIDALVRPESMMRVMQDGKVAPNVGPSNLQEPKQKPVWAIERKGVNKVIAYARKEGAEPVASDVQPGFVFERTGFADWKLTGVRLPAP